MLQVNVPSIRLRSANVPVTTIILNAIRSNGVPITAIIPSLVPCRLLLTDNARTESPITNNVKKTDRGLVANLVTSIPVLPDACMQPQTAVLMTVLTANAVQLRPLPDARPIIPLTVTLPVALPVPTLAVILVIAVVPTNVREGRKTTAEAKREQPNADQSVVIAVPHVQAVVPLIPVPLFLTMNAAAHVVLVLLLVLPEHHRQTPEAAVVQQKTNVELKPVIILINHATLTPILVRVGILLLVLTDIPIRPPKPVLAVQLPVLVINVTPPLPAAPEVAPAAKALTQLLVLVINHVNPNSLSFFTSMVTVNH